MATRPYVIIDIKVRKRSESLVKLTIRGEMVSQREENGLFPLKIGQQQEVFRSRNYRQEHFFFNFEVKIFLELEIYIELQKNSLICKTKQ